MTVDQAADRPPCRRRRGAPVLGLAPLVVALLVGAVLGALCWPKLDEAWSVAADGGFPEC